jgi:hypothetical protein
VSRAGQAVVLGQVVVVTYDRIQNASFAMEEASMSIHTEKLWKLSAPTVMATQTSAKKGILRLVNSVEPIGAIVQLFQHVMSAICAMGKVQRSDMWSVR